MGTNAGKKFKEKDATGQSNIETKKILFVEICSPCDNCAPHAQPFNPSKRWFGGANKFYEQTNCMAQC